MFTGIIHNRYPVSSINDQEGLRTFSVGLSEEFCSGLKIGASVSVSGVCLTATKIENGNVFFDVMQETLVKTTISNLKQDELVNIERSARVGDEIGGHRVSGHVTGMAEIANIEDSANNRVITFVCDPSWMEYILPKGFIALDGCSLTVVDVLVDRFTVHFIPETLEKTTFGTKKVGDKVNLEIDPQTQAIVETVKRYVEQHP